jgi:ABC-2 type transport system permease protein
VLRDVHAFDGAIRTPGIGYVDYLMPGAFILTVTASAVTTTGVGFAEDLANGAIDRNRSLPIAAPRCWLGDALPGARSARPRPPRRPGRR